ncbi:Uncharacterised protein [Klebsiella variicola]|nr:Uncharacterised protein [Klebsiella variicola]
MIGCCAVAPINSRRIGPGAVIALQERRHPLRQTIVHHRLHETGRYRMLRLGKEVENRPLLNDTAACITATL